MQKGDLALSLEEFGLSKYEARAYITLLNKGHLSASELAYHASLPRTKVYVTMTKLVKKGLAVITRERPAVYTAVSPDDAFSELVAAQQMHVDNMKNMMESLQRMNDERNPQGSEEHKYIALDPAPVAGMLDDLISAARSTIALMLDSWGMRLISQCNNSVMKAASNNVQVKVLTGRECVSNRLLMPLPDSVHVKVGKSCTNMFIFDKCTVVLVDGSSGKGVLFRSSDILSKVCNRIFEREWIVGEYLTHLGFASSTALLDV